MIEERILNIRKTIVIEPAQKREVDTGEFRKVYIAEADGEMREELRPMMRQFIDPPKTQDINEQIIRYVIRDGEEEHFFVDQEDAISFEMSKPIVRSTGDIERPEAEKTIRVQDIPEKPPTPETSEDDLDYDLEVGR